MAITAKRNRRKNYKAHEAIPVSLDIGNGRVKYMNLDDPDSAFVDSFPSVYSVEYGEHAIGFRAAGLTRGNDFLISWNGKTYAVGDTVRSHGLTPVEIRHQSRISTDFYRVMFAAALTRLVIPTSDIEPAVIQPIVSLPPAYFNDAETQRKALAGEYVISVGSRTYQYIVPENLIEVVIEGFGAAMWAALDEYGGVDRSPTSIFGKTVGILDCGTWSTNLVMLDNAQLQRRGTTTSPHGLSDIHKKLVALAAENGVMVEASDADKVLNQKWYLKAGDRVDIKRFHKSWSAEWAENCDALIQTHWNGGNAVQAIILAGGGAPLVAPILRKRYKHLQTFDDIHNSWAANCDGAGRYLLFLRRTKYKVS